MNKLLVWLGCLVVGVGVIVGVGVKTGAILYTGPSLDRDKSDSMLAAEPEEGYLFDGLEANPAITAKLDSGEPISEAEWREIQEYNIRKLARYDARAAKLAQELLENGHLAGEEYVYLEEKRKEMQKLYFDEIHRKLLREQGQLEK